jgi:peptide/nickel transport system substrate-binding protein
MSIIALALAACTPRPEGGEQQAGRGFGGCEENPNTCNSADRRDGGSITWIVNAKPGGWFAYSPEGGSVYTIQMLHGIYPYTGQWEPDGKTYKYNMDLLAEEPELLGESPFRYQFKFRPEAVWDDGTPITADDWIVSWKMSTSAAEGHCTGCRPRSTGKADSIESVEGSDNGKTVTVTLKDGQADPEWFGWFSAHSIGGGLMPAHIAKNNGLDVNDPAQLGQYFEYLNRTMPTFSGGPYRLVQGDLENQVIKEPNDRWYGQTKPTLDTVVIRFIDDEGAWAPALSNGEVHGASPATFGEDVIRSVQGMPNVHLDISPGPSWEHVDFNLQNPWFADVALRRAIFTAIDANDIANRVYGSLFPDYTLRTNHIFGRNSEYHVDHLGPTGQGSGDAEKALGILRDAGYAFDGTTLTKDGRTVGPFRLRSTATPVRSTSMELIQSYLREIGIEITIQPTDNLGNTLNGQDYDIMQFGWSGSPFFTVSPTQYWHTGSGSNFGKYSDPEVDRLVDDAAKAASLDEAARLANDATKLVVDDAYVLPLFDTPVYVFVTDAYTNVRDNPASSLRGLYNNHEWGLIAE